MNLNKVMALQHDLNLRVCFLARSMSLDGEGKPSGASGHRQYERERSSSLSSSLIAFMPDLAALTNLYRGIVRRVSSRIA
jgi:hypothetical protein